MDKEKLIKRLMTTFLEELEEHVGALNRNLLALEKDPGGAERAEQLQTLFRTVHSLKGAARSVNASVLESACHSLEDILAAARDAQAPLDGGLFALLFETADAIEEAGMRLREQPDLGGSPLAALLPRLEAGAGRASAARRPPVRERAAAPMTPVDERHPSPPAAPLPVAPLPAAVPVPLPSPPAASLELPASSGTVRVAADKLDDFLARSGELLVARRRVQSRAADLAALREFVGRWKTEWRTVEKALRRQRSAASRSRHEPEGPALLIADHGPLTRRAVRALDRVGDHLRQLDKDLERLATVLAGDGSVLKQSADALDDEVRRVRMLPFAEACQGLERMVHDLAQAGGKEVDLVIEGGAVELDRSVLEGLKDPLRHLVRNGVDHGIEAVSERRAAGKSSRARITVAAVLCGTQVEVTVADDGRGLDLDALRQQAIKRSLTVPVDERELARLVFRPGFSTAALITDVSGRGMGLDVVKNRVDNLRGTVDLSFAPGRGTRFTLAVPLTLTTLRALLVSAGGQTFALADSHVRKLVRVDPTQLRCVEGRDMAALGGPPLPVVALAELLGLPSAPPQSGARIPGLVVAVGERQLVLLVEEFLLAQEIVIKNLGVRIRRVRHISGATILPSGRIALVLNTANLIRTALARTPGRGVAAALAPTTMQARKRILLADDSVTTRTLEKSILEAAGYEVAAAADGAAAWHLLHERGADLVVSDVEMPRMDGFALTQAIRDSKRFRALPVVLVTARETEQDKARGIQAGADAYLVKSAFDQKNLLETIAQLL